MGVEVEEKETTSRARGRARASGAREEVLSCLEGASAGLVGPQAQSGLPRMGDSEGEGEPMLLGDAGDQVCEGEALPSLASSSKEKSWAAVVNGERPAAKINMPPLEKKEVAGIKLISQQSYEVFCHPFKFNAIATLAGGAGKGRLDYSFIFTSLRSIWPGVAHLRFTSVGKGMFLIRTSSEDDLKLILSPGRWYVGGRLLIANQWHPGMPMRIESSSRVRIWIRLPELLVEWWNPRVFTDIAELIGGAFVEADEYTRHIQRLGFARIKIEIPLGFCPLSEIELEVAGGKVVAQSIEYETKVKYCHKCGSTGHFDGSCHFAEASKEGAKVAPNVWHLVKVPKRRSPLNKIKENLQLKQNKFEALSQLLEEKADGVSSHDERQHASPAEKGQDNTESVVTHNVHASINQVSHVSQNGKAEGLDPKPGYPPKPISIGIDPNPLDGYSMDKPAEKAKKRSLKHREVNGTKKRTSLPKISDQLDFAGGGQQADEDTPMMGADQGTQEDLPLDEMETISDEGKAGSQELADVQDGDFVNTQLTSWEGREHGQPCPWARIIAMWDPAEVTLQNWYAHSHWMFLKFFNTASAQSFVAVRVYLHTDFRLRKDQLLSLCSALNQCNAPVICMGDFNAVLTSNEKTGRAPTLQGCLALSNFVQQSALHEVSCPDMKFTWTNNRVGHENIMSKIDRCYVSKEWVDDPDNLVHLEDMEGYVDQVQSAWTVDVRGCTMIKLIHKLEATRDKLKVWDWVLTPIARLGPTVTPKENVDLLKPVSDSEITWAVMKADKDSAPGPDEFGNSFFQSNWHTVREVVSGAIRGFFDSGRLVKSVNKTHITLLPKEPSRLSLIKHALSLLPSYLSLVVKLPATICNQLNKMAAESYGGDMADHKSVHHIKWSTLCLPLLEGGVGLRRYCERKGFLASSVSGKRVSNVWHRALQCWRKVNENVGWKIGNGELAKFWTDHWGADRLMDKISASHFHLIQDTITCSVKELLEENGEALMDYLAKLNIFFPCPPLQVDRPDVMVWRNGDNGFSGRLPTDALVQHQGYSLASRSYVCKQATEDIKHLFYDCKGARSLWSFIYGKFGRASPWRRSPPNLMEGLSSWHKKGFQDKSLDKCWKDSFHMAWNDQQSTNIRNWIRSGILWSNGVRFVDKWVEISITSWYKQGRKGVAGFIRDGSGQVQFGVACWFELSPGWPETQILKECLGHLANVADNMGRICLLANNGDWKNFILSHRGCRSDLLGNRVQSNSYIDRIKVCKGWPLVEDINLLMITPDNGLYTTWNPQESL
ncbi:putative ribonuclease H protein [Nymphaea thermarum]|nr:putative ribonuclease H protein [Nymphaea thermarum]